MKLAEELLVAENIDDLGTVIYALRRKIPMPRLYCIVYVYEKNRYELISSIELCRSTHTPVGIVVGVANGRRQGLDLIGYLLEEAVQAGKDLNDPQTWLEGIVDTKDEKRRERQ